ncbi:hypothetical protein ACFQV8_30570 [Pseudonocardia benzenivorans]
MRHVIRPTATHVVTGAVVLLVVVSQLAVTGGFFSQGSLSTLTP